MPKPFAIPAEYTDVVMSLGNVGPLPGTKPTEPTPLQKAEAKLADAESQLKQLSSAGKGFGTVLEVRKDEVVICTNGTIVSAAHPTFKVERGDTVHVVMQTRQILDRCDPILVGQVSKVAKVIDENRCEISDQTGSPIVVFSGRAKVKKGDRIILDQSGTIAISVVDQAVEVEPISDEVVTWDDIGGLADAKRELIDIIETPFHNKELYSRYGQKPPKGVLLYGGPGVGKTMLGKAVASSIARTHGKRHAGAFIYIKGPEILNKFVGQSEENIRDMFERARAHKNEHGYPATIFIDEAEALLGNRGAEDSFGINYMGKTVVPQFLSEMDGMEESGAFVLLATNLPTSLDPAIVRDGRIDRKIHVKRPDQATTQQIFALHLRGKPTKDSKELAEVGSKALFDDKRVICSITLKKVDGSAETEPVNITLGQTVNGAMIAGIVQRATQHAIRRELAGSKDEGVVPDDMTKAVEETHLESSGTNLSSVIAELVEPALIEAIKRTGHASSSKRDNSIN